MGLDVYLYKVMKPEEADEDRHYFSTSHDNWKEKFKDYIVTKDIKYVDYNEELDKLGITDDDIVSILDASDSDNMLLTLVNGSIVKIKGKEIVIPTEGMYVKEIVYQRKGANSQFYKDGIWNSPPILDLEIVKEHRDKYFDEFDARFINLWEEGRTFLYYC